ncbi:hypothetical protein CDL12_28338 [Handroanthus impetiginosus]|uniref:Homing endonuclease LAGLIDADG domain-containing protein n=1 Tax=Handroanthus impetiginosus TaxID=429701 RepID=A0A2G9G1Z9_9LAMI|nr:hypothetical protein CDL12_28338 [Handroanthus impetiginosus]
MIAGILRNLCKVTSHKMNESEMGNRVTKSIRGFTDFSQSVYNLIVKAQRVYGSFCIGFTKIQIRCTLMVQEIGYPIKILSKFLTSKVESNLHPMFVTAICDKELLLQISKFFDVGNIRITEKVVYYTVTSLKDLEVVVNHFSTYQLQTKKGADFQLFEKAFYIIKNKLHLTPEGSLKIVKLKAARDGSFTIGIQQSNSKKRLRFNITQDIRDMELMVQICDYFGCGSIYINNQVASYNVYSNKKNIAIIAEFFSKYPVKGQKNRQFTK